MDQLELLETTTEIFNNSSCRPLDGLENPAPNTKNEYNSSQSSPVEFIKLENDSMIEVHDVSELKSDSEAETIVLSGKNGNSPSMAYKSTRYVDKNGYDYLDGAPSFEHIKGSEGDDMLSNYGRVAKHTASFLGKRKRPRHFENDSVDHRNFHSPKSTSISPYSTIRSQAKLATSDSEILRSSSPHSTSYSPIQRKARSADLILPGRDYSNIGKPDDEQEEDIKTRRTTRPQSSSIESRINSDFYVRSSLDIDAKVPKLTYSPSHDPWEHKISNSSQFQSDSSRGFSQMKKHVPTPQISTDYLSDEFSTGEKSQVQRSRVHNSISSTTRDSAISSTKMGPLKKHVNCSGQTPLAVACSRGKLDLVRKRYQERPQDINVPDNALNTPLHIASLEGWTDIVKFLVDTGKCELDCINTVKDTPLHDAIDNRNLEVVKVLMDAGANPSKPNQAGNDPLDLLNLQEKVKDEEAAQIIQEMKKAVISAREKFASDNNLRSEDISIDDKDISDGTNAKSSSRHASPILNNDSQTSSLVSRKVGTARSLMKTTEHALYQAYDLDALRVAARDGDIAAVSRVLDVRPGLNDAQTLYNAAKGGHDAVINLLFALGEFDPDPEPLNDLPQEYSTPILAAIGKDNHLEVIKLFLGNSRFNPARRIRGETYSKIALRRCGPRSQEESILLKNAFEAYQNMKGLIPHRAQSSGSQHDNRAQISDYNKNKRRDDFQNSRSQDRTSSSPKLDERKGIKGQNKDRFCPSKRSLGKAKSEDESPGVFSEPEIGFLGLPKQRLQSRNTDSEITVLSENEPCAKPRRKLVSRKELKDERGRIIEKRRRASFAAVTSATSGLVSEQKKERFHPDTKYNGLGRNFAFDGASNLTSQIHSPSNESESSSEKNHPEKLMNNYVKRKDSRDFLPLAQDDLTLIRNRKNENKTYPGNRETTINHDEFEEKAKKRRKLENETLGLSKTDSTNLSPDLKTPFNSIHRQEGLSQNSPHGLALQAKEPQVIKNSQSPVISKETNSVDTVSLSSPVSSSLLTALHESHENETEPIDDKLDFRDNFKGLSPLTHLTRKNDDHSDILEIKSETRSTESTELKEIRDKTFQQVEDKTQARPFLDQSLKEETNKRQNEEIDNINQKGFEDLEAQKKTQDEQRLRYQEQEKIKREEQDRRKAIILEQQRVELVRHEEEQLEKRLSKLPLLLKWFDQTPEPKTAAIARLFNHIVGYRYDTINIEATGRQGGNDQWMLNIHAAILLGEKDLQLSRYTAWERIILTTPQKRGVWSTCSGIFLLLDGGLQCLRNQLPHDTQPMHDIIEMNKRKFLELDLFFVKVTEFMYVLPNFPHLRGIEMVVLYRELRIPQSSDETVPSRIKMKWNQDVQFNSIHNLAPLPKYYLNGILTSRMEESTTRVLRKAPLPDTYPRRMGLTRVYPGESDYDEIRRNKKSYKCNSLTKSLKNLINDENS
ncbi:ankyrin repeat protein [Golovinomyces cichoracearum]|uniref:Ankyrin repeat protein n=1 Tax=Golovinomyces cichoracearum TaxID=62708 RepID=A0A420J2H2_9PEZI|nr:ankyrin repeat protein [Golovinomyces cichoracearum]